MWYHAYHFRRSDDRQQQAARSLPQPSPSISRLNWCKPHVKEKFVELLVCLLDFIRLGV